MTKQTEILRLKNLGQLVGIKAPFFLQAIIPYLEILTQNQSVEEF